MQETAIGITMQNTKLDDVDTFETSPVSFNTGFTTAGEIEVVVVVVFCTVSCYYPSLGIMTGITTIMGSVK